MYKKKSTYVFFIMMFVFAPNIFSANTTINDHNKINFAQGGITINPNPPFFSKPDSEFASSSFVSSEKFSKTSSFTSKNKEKFSKRSFSMRKESSFSAGPTSRPKSDKDISSGSLFSMEEEAEFSSKPYPATKYNNGEFSGVSSMVSGSVFSTP